MAEDTVAETVEPGRTGAIILAAGKGTRMKSAVAKVLHPVFYQPMLLHVLAAVQNKALGLTKAVVVIGHQKEAVAALIDALPGVEQVEQSAQLGTGHAALCAEKTCSDLKQVFILCGDTPCLRSETLAAMRACHAAAKAALTVMTAKLDHPFGYGRIVRSAEGDIAAIVEEKDASEAERALTEINTGVYLVETKFLFQALKQLRPANKQAELYLTDIVALARREGQKTAVFLHHDAREALGVNSRLELAQADLALQRRRNAALMAAGITIISPETTRVAPDCHIEPDCVLQGQVSIEEGSTLGPGCFIEQGVVLRGCHLGAGARVGANSVLSGVTVQENALVPALSRHVG